jgi:hypothetical protein
VRVDSVDCPHRFIKLCLLGYLVCVMTVLTARTASSKFSSSSSSSEFCSFFKRPAHAGPIC